MLWYELKTDLRIAIALYLHSFVALQVLGVGRRPRGDRRRVDQGGGEPHKASQVPWDSLELGYGAGGLRKSLIFDLLKGRHLS